MTNPTNVMASIMELARYAQAINQQVVRQYQPVVEDIIATGSRDVRHIEHTLDGLLDFCGGHGPALELSRRLCRHSWEIDPVATVAYVNVCREGWDSAAAGMDMQEMEQ